MKLRQLILGSCSAGTIILFIAAILVSGSVAQAASLTSIRNVSQDGGGNGKLSALPKVAQDPQGNTHVIWDSQEGGARIVRYAKGVWNGSNYDFGASIVIDDVGGYQYATPSIGVAPNGTVMAAWSDGAMRIKTWNQNSTPTPGKGTAIGGKDGSRKASIGVDSSSNFHIVWDGNFNVQYCLWNGSSCARRDNFSGEGSNRPDIAIDSDDGVHVVWDSGQNTKYRARSKDGGWGSVQGLGGGNAAQIAADGQGNVYIAWSQDFDIQYCRRKLNTGCQERSMFSAGGDAVPSVAATTNGNVAIVWRETNGKRLWMNVRDNGSWSGAQNIANGPTDPDLSYHPYTTRISLVWSLDWEIDHITILTSGQTATPVPPTPAPPTPIPNPAGQMVIVPEYTAFSGAPGVDSSFTVIVTNTGAPATHLTLTSTDSNGAPLSVAYAFTSPQTQVTWTFPPGTVLSSCETKTLTGVLSDDAGRTSVPFSAAMLVDPAVLAEVIARNPNLEGPNSAGTSIPGPANGAAINAVPNDFGPRDAGSPSYTRSEYFFLSISGIPGECSDIKDYALTYVQTPDSTVPVNGTPQFTPLRGNGRPGLVRLPSNLPGLYRFYITVRDNASNVKVWPSADSSYALQLDYEAPKVSGPGLTLSSNGNGMATGNFGDIAVTDNIYRAPDAPSRQYWGAWMVVKRVGTGAPTDAEWANSATVLGGALSPTTPLNLDMGMVGLFTPGQYQLYIRYLDGAGNAATTINSSPVQINTLGGPRIFLPSVRLP